MLLLSFLGLCSLSVAIGLPILRPIWPSPIQHPRVDGPPLPSCSRCGTREGMGLPLAMAVAVALAGLVAPVPGALEAAGQDRPRRVVILSVNDVYKLVGLPSDLPYFYLKEDFAYVDEVAASACDGRPCNTDLESCGWGAAWEACFPSKFGKATFLSLKQQAEGVQVVVGPCGKEPAKSTVALPPNGSHMKFGGLLDFSATFRWLKEEATTAGDLAIGTLAGDFIGPSYLGEVHRGKQLVEVMSHMGIDLVNIGNHDVDYKVTVLREQMNRSAFHYLNANLEDSSGLDIQQPMVGSATVEGNMGEYTASEWRRLSVLPGSRFGRGWAMLDKGGVRVCVLGTSDTDKMNWLGKKVKGTARDIPAAVAILRGWERGRLGCTLRVAMTHTRAGNDLNLFRAVEHAGLHLDAIIGGHDHYAVFAELRRLDGGTTFFVKAGADAQAISRLTFDVPAGRPPSGSLEVVPVVAGACEHRALDPGRAAWFAKTRGIFEAYAREAQEADGEPLNVVFQGVYDTGIVRDAESVAVNMWLDFMRESTRGDVLFFQAGLVRQDTYQRFSEGVPLSRLQLLEEFPWGDEDVDARSSLFPFRVSVEDLVTRTLPFVAKAYWCRAPFNDANRIHVSGLIVEMENEEGCDAVGDGSPIRSVTLVGGCHWRGTLEDVAGGCCSSPLCGKLWSAGAWDPRMTPEARGEQLTVVTGQFCVPSKYGSHGPGFHEVGMLCPGAEPAENWASGAAFARAFAGRGVAGPDAGVAPVAVARDFGRFGYFFKRALMALFQGLTVPLRVGGSAAAAAACEEAGQWYEASSFVGTCLCELGLGSSGGAACGGGRVGRGGFPRFLAAPRAAFEEARSVSCAGPAATCSAQGQA
ncbi:unnamed protein product [Prorocentrum cordatum]|uniref:5'-nucleotidase n=1 Tax=Prorocentrum cordatum TaxID=2364126 RepID=A0ABN9VU52_9DINO|nr:unnamed protein product [Polarella glacialis]